MKEKGRWIELCMVISTIIVFLFSSCTQKQDYETLKRSELAKGIKVDSVMYGVRLGMEFDRFFDYCFNLNLQGRFKPNQSGTMVKVDLKDGFSFPAYFEFFPKPPGKHRVIYSFDGTIGYKNYSQFDKRYSIEKLLKETLNYFEDNYNGNDFIKVPNENKLLKYKYIKIDGTRQITIEPTFIGQSVIVRFDDLSYLENNEKK